MSGLGGTCNSYALDCSSGLDACIKGGWSGGYCSKVCTSNPGACPGGSTCAQYALAGASYCLANCTYNGGQSTCRPGYVCERNLSSSTPGATLCFAACPGNACATGTTCDNGFCCGAPFFKCCSTGAPCPSGGTCQANGYCQ